MRSGAPTSKDLATVARAAAVALACGAGIACAGAGDGIDRSEGAAGLRGRAPEAPLLVPAFTLEDTDGRPFAFRAETADRVSFLFFGYTHCPDICPVQMAVLDAALEDLPYADRRRTRVVFVTTDPERDTPERLRVWLDRFDPGFVGLRGDLARVNEILAALGLPPAARDPAGPEDGYLVGHATPVLAIGPDGFLLASYPSGIRQADWKHDLPLLLDALRAAPSPDVPAPANGR